LAILHTVRLQAQKLSFVTKERQPRWASRVSTSGCVVVGFNTNPPGRAARVRPAGRRVVKARAESGAEENTRGSGRRLGRGVQPGTGGEDWEGQPEKAGSCKARHGQTPARNPIMQDTTRAAGSM